MHVANGCSKLKELDLYRLVTSQFFADSYHSRDLNYNKGGSGRFEQCSDK